MFQRCLLFDLGYPSGRLYFNGSFQDSDLIFREGVGIPEPPSLVLLGFALAVLIGMKPCRRALSHNSGFRAPTKNLVLGLATMLMASAAARAQGQFSFSGPSTYQQVPEYPGGSGICSGAVSWADDFAFSQPTSIEQVTWWSKDTPSPSQSFAIQILNDDHGLPGIALADYEIEVTTTEQVGINGIEHRFTTTLSSPVSVQSNVSYWLRVYSLDYPNWSWSSARSANQPWNAYSVNGGKWTQSWGTDVAFALNTIPDIVPEPAASVLLPLAIGLVLAVRRFRSHGRRGTPATEGNWFRSAPFDLPTGEVYELQPISIAGELD